MARTNTRTPTFMLPRPASLADRAHTCTWLYAARCSSNYNKSINGPIATATYDYARRTFTFYSLFRRFTDVLKVKEPTRRFVSRFTAVLFALQFSSRSCRAVKGLSGRW